MRPSRFFAGALNGIAANIKTMISEICGSEHEVVGMSLVTGAVTADLHHSMKSLYRILQSADKGEKEAACSPSDMKQLYVIYLVPRTGR